MAERFSDLVTRVYHADRGDTGRGMTRDVVLPLAEAMLIRDPIYIATMATSREEVRRLRRLLNVRRSRGDEMKQRYLTRFELVALRRRIRLQLRTSDWPLWMLSSFRRLVPARWRGSRAAREVRWIVETAVERAAQGAATDYERWAEVMGRLHAAAAGGRLRGMPPAEVAALVDGPSAEPASAPALQSA
jgi:hypothetical protein